MPDERLQTCIYRVLRYTPNLVRDEWINIGILLYDRRQNRLEVRLLEEPSEFARLRRLHPNADLNLLGALQGDFEQQIAAHQSDLSGYIAQLDETLSNVLQLSPQRALLAENFEAELDRLYRDHVEPPRYKRPAGAEVETTRAGIRRHIREAFQRAGILDRMEPHVRVQEFTYRGDPLRLDYAYRRNGTRGFVHALALSRDPAQAKVLVYTAERIRMKVPNTELAAITEMEPRPDNDREQFVARLLAEQAIRLVPLARLDDFAKQLGFALF